MATKSNGAIAPDHIYNAREVANILGCSEQKWKVWIRENVKFCQPFEGMLLVTGRMLFKAIEEHSDHDTDEAKEQRRQRAGVNRRRAKAAK